MFDYSWQFHEKLWQPQTKIGRVLLYERVFRDYLFSHKLDALIIVYKKSVAAANWKNALF